MKPDIPLNQKLSFSLTELYGVTGIDDYYWTQMVKRGLLKSSTLPGRKHRVVTIWQLKEFFDTYENNMPEADVKKNRLSTKVDRDLIKRNVKEYIERAKSGKSLNNI